jgi:choline-sulfatase
MLAESAVAPLVMLKRDNYKYIYSAPDPEQLFDLQADPLEARNLAGEPRHESVRASMEVEVKSRWDLETLTEQVLASQRRRLFLREVLAKGKRPDWDFHPHDEASKHCLRGGGVYNEWCYSDIVPLRNDLLGKYPDTR